MKILHLIDSFDFTASARQLQILGPRLHDGSTEIEVCCLGTETPWLNSMRRAGVIVHALDWTRWFDPSVLLNLRAILREAIPDVIHVWRLPALRMLAAVDKALLPRTVVSGADLTRSNLAWFDRKLLQKVGRVADDLIIAPQKRCQDPFQRAACTIMCIGRLERERGVREAIWAFDFLRHLYPDAQLQIVGAGSQHAALQGLVAGLRAGASVQFLGARVDAADLLAEATIVWVPSLANCGRQTALEAMALGRPVIASNVPLLRELIADGSTGILVPPGDVVQLARKTRLLLEDASYAARLGDAARQIVENRFPLERTIERWRDLYRAVAA